MVTEVIVPLIAAFPVIVNVPKRPVRLEPSVESGGLDDIAPTREIFEDSNVGLKLVPAD